MAIAAILYRRAVYLAAGFTLGAGLVLVITLSITSPHAEERSTPSEQHIHLLVVSHARCGSSFVGEIFNQYFKALYWFEPLYGLHGGRTENVTGAETGDMPATMTQGTDQTDDEKLKILEAIAGCRVDALPDAVLRSQHLHRSHGVQTVVRTRCAEPGANKWGSLPSGRCRAGLADYCRKSPIVVSKVIRANMKTVGRLLERHPAVRVVYLVRDPRGWTQSRQRLWWQGLDNADVLRRVARQCSDVDADLETIRRLPAGLRDNVHVLRYEDFALHPGKYAAELFRFAGLAGGLSASVAEWLEGHTRHWVYRRERMNPFETVRRSDETAYEWRKWMKRRMQIDVYDQCGEHVKKLGYPR